MVQVITIGGCAIDLISYCDRFPMPGETLIGYCFEKGFGGKTANQTVMAAKLGLSTAIISKVGDDSFGRDYVQHLKELNINVDYLVMTKESHTSAATITVTKEGQNHIVYTSGAGDLLTAADVAKAEPLFSPTKNGSLKLALATYEAPESALEEFLKIAKKYKVQTLVNGAPPLKRSMEKLYPLMDIFCVNETELSAATGYPTDSLEDISHATDHLLEQGCQNVVVTLGEKGAMVASKHEHAPQTITCPQVSPVVDTTGAGDALVGSLAYFLVCRPELSLTEQVCRACAIASISVTKKGTQTSFPSLDLIPKDLLH